ncbi:hypothetical protein JAAARDRAFT_62142 [Jaapia argillacea MUCL 33604]|uniref:Uncharacterized protein n=1 Tax=Jaapia argillacea MUCL 33604 TaxID=933084 RepID=A0A067PAN7_9AGAM|nr:hypothetical protein JAAARDRAFT_62142 [Jaapia argillacea MUCL 33604]
MLPCPSSRPRSVSVRPTALHCIPESSIPIPSSSRIDIEHHHPGLLSHLSLSSSPRTTLPISLVSGFILSFDHLDPHSRRWTCPNPAPFNDSSRISPPSPHSNRLIPTSFNLPTAPSNVHVQRSLHSTTA